MYHIRFIKIVLAVKSPVEKSPGSRFVANNNLKAPQSKLPLFRRLDKLPEVEAARYFWNWEFLGGPFLDDNRRFSYRVSKLNVASFEPIEPKRALSRMYVVEIILWEVLYISCTFFCVSSVSSAVFCQTWPLYLCLGNFDFVGNINPKRDWI